MPWGVESVLCKKHPENASISLKFHGFGTTFALFSRLGNCIWVLFVAFPSNSPGNDVDGLVLESRVKGKFQNISS